MDFIINNLYHGFRLIRGQRIDEINSVLRLFYHEKSGAKLISLQNDDDNNVFSITFKTPYSSSDGVQHITEHCVLNGSRKYPTKDLFAELRKGSVNTYLNAGTADDRTSFSVASKNTKDFFNLMGVYLDCTLSPEIYNKKEYFMQQGWHYELNNLGDEIQYNGVVYNEMKAIYSWPEELLIMKTKECLYPDTSYRYDAGGSPEEIPNLTYRELLDFHKERYHPSNSYIYLYGNFDILERLEFINNQYLKNFNKIETNIEVEFQEPFSQPKEITTSYSISTEDSEVNKTFLSLSFVIGNLRDGEVRLATEILNYILLGAPGAPLKKAIMDANIGADVFSLFFPYVYQPFLSINLVSSNEEDKGRFKEIVINTLKDIVINGIDKGLIEAAINKVEFSLREGDAGDYPRGMLQLSKVLQSWIYDGEPDAHIAYEKHLEKIKLALTTDYFEKMIEKYLINNNHSSLVVLKPQKGKAEESSKQLKEKLAKYKESLTEEELNYLVRTNIKLKEIQQTPESKEILEKIPRILISDIDKNAKKSLLYEDEIRGTKILKCPYYTNGISYINLLFDTKGVEEDLLPYVGLLAEVLGKVDSNKYNYTTLNNAIDSYTGGIHFSIDNYIDSKDVNKYYPKLKVRAKILSQNSSKLVELLDEIIKSPIINDKKRLKEIIQGIRSNYELSLIQQGHNTVANRLHSYFSNPGKYMDIVTGFEFYKFICKLDEDFNSFFDEIVSNLKKVSDKIFNRQNLTFTFIGSEDDYKKSTNEISSFLEGLKKEPIDIYNYSFNLTQKNEGLMMQSGVQYVAKGYDYLKLGYNYSGSMRVMSTIIAKDYLWNNIRLKGGAYGAFVRNDRYGKLIFTSYRDPKLKETLSVYDNASQYLLNFKVDNKEIERYIVSTIGEMDIPMTAANEGEKDIRDYMSHIAFEDLQREREEVLNTTAGSIRELSRTIGDVMKQNHICILGDESRIKENKEIFYSITKAFK